MQSITELYASIKPLIQSQVDLSIAKLGRVSGGSNTTISGNYLLKTGDTVTGDIAVNSGVKIDGYDLSATFVDIYAQLAATEAFAHSGLGLSHTDDGTTYTLILSSSSYPGAAASILASDSSGKLGVQNLGIGVAGNASYALYSTAALPSHFANDVRVGTTTAGTMAARLHVLLGSTAPQMQLSYDASNYGFLFVGSTGAFTIANTGTTPANAHLYLNPGGGSGKIGIGNSIPTPTAKLEVNSTTEQLRLNYGAATYAAFTAGSSGNLNIDATGGNIYTTDHVGHSSYVSQLSYWRISNAGEADFRYVYTDELHAKAFIADLEQALAGGQIISKSVAKVYANFTVPTAGNTGNLDVEEFAGFAGFHVFVDGDLVRLRQFDRSGGGLKIADIWGTVVYSAQVSSSNPPAQRYVFTRHATYPGTGSGTISAGTLVLDYGTSDNGYMEQNAIDGASGANSPYYQIVSWNTHPKSTTAGQGLKLRVRLGQLRGLTGANQWGLYAGTGWTANPQESNVAQYTVTTPTVDNNHRYILAGDNGVNIYNADLTIYSSTTPVISLSRTAPSIAVGSGSDTMGYLSGAAGFWVGNDSGTYKMRLGSLSGGVLSQGYTWDGSRLNIVGSVSLGPSSSLNYGTSIGSPLLMLRFDGDATGHRGQVATASGNNDFARGKFGRALSAGRTATNLVTNGSFEGSTTNWTLNKDGTGTMTSNTTTAVYGASALRMARVGGTYHYAASSSISVSASTAYTISGWLKANRGSSAATLTVWQYNGASYLAGQDKSIAFTAGVHDWEFKTLAFTSAATATAVIVVLSSNNTDSIEYWDAIQLEAGSVATPYVTGTRTNSAYVYSAAGQINAESGSIGFWYMPTNIGTSGGYIFATHTTWLSNALFIQQYNGAITASINNTFNATSSATLSAGTWVRVDVTWGAGSLKLYLNGVQVATASPTSYFTPGANIKVGGTTATTGFEADGLIDDFYITDRVLSADEVKAIYNSNAPVSISNDPYSLYLYGDNNQGYVRGNATGLFGYSSTSGSAGTGAFALVTTASTALGTAFGSATLDAGDMMLGSASTGYSNLLWDQSAGSLALRTGTTSRLTLNSSGNLVITNGSGTSMLTLNGAETLARLTGILFVDSNGEIRSGNGTVGGGTFTGIRIMNYGASTVMGGYYNDALQWDIGNTGQMRFGVVSGNPSLTLDSTGIQLTTTTSYAAINALKWNYSGTYTGIIYGIVNTGALTSTLILQSQPYSGGSIGAIDLNAYSTAAQTAARLYLVGAPNSATAGPYMRLEFRNTSNTLIGGNFTFVSTAATSATMTGAGIVRYWMHYRATVRTSGGVNTTITGDLALNAANVHTINGNNVQVGVSATGYVYWQRNTGAETYDITFWAICT